MLIISTVLTKSGQLANMRVRLIIPVIILVSHQGSIVMIALYITIGGRTKPIASLIDISYKAKTIITNFLMMLNWDCGWNNQLHCR